MINCGMDQAEEALEAKTPSQSAASTGHAGRQDSTARPSGDQDDHTKKGPYAMLTNVCLLAFDWSMRMCVCDYD